MTERLRTLVRIMQFGAIKVAPGFVNILMIPYLHRMMGGAGFGQFSLFLNYALLTITVLSAAVTQPMYRFLSSDRGSLSRFHAFAVMAGGLGSLGGAVSVLFVGGTPRQAVTGATFVLSAILYTVITVRYQIEAKIRRLALLEAVRVLILAAVVLAGPLATGTIGFEAVLMAFMLSYLVPLIFSVGGLRVELPDRAWLATRIGFGFKSAVWLVLAGLPFALSKTLLAGRVSPVELGAYSANADMYYRIFSILNVAVAMWAFPAMSTAYDAGRLQEARRTLWFGIGVYCTAGISVMAVAIAGAFVIGQFPGQMEGGAVSFSLIIFSCFLWQGMSLGHKPLELANRPGLMVIFMSASFILFAVLYFKILLMPGLDPASAIATALILSSAAYCAVAFCNDNLSGKQV